MRKLIIFVVVVIVLLIAADRVGDVVAERLVADKVQSSQGLQQRPDVNIDGIPFLTQFASGHYQHIEIDASDVRVGSTSLYVSDLDVDFRTITVSRDFDSFKAQTANARATVDYASLSRLLGIQVRYAGGDKLAFTAKLPVVGRKTVTFDAKYANGALEFGQGAVNGLGQFGSKVESVLDKYLGDRTPLRDFPFDVRVRQVDVDRSGLQIALAGRNITYGG